MANVDANDEASLTFNAVASGLWFRLTLVYAIKNCA